MKSLESMIVEKRGALVASKKVTDAVITESLKDCPSLEHQLAKLDQLLAKHDIKESRPRIARNNGGNGPSSKDVITEQEQGLTTGDVVSLNLAKTYGLTLREAFMHGANTDLGVEGKLPERVVAALIAEWKRYFPHITDSDVKSLAARGIRP